MKKSEIKKTIAQIDKKWYYYYNFDGIEVHKKVKNVETRGLNNWKKLEQGMKDVFEKVNKPCVLDVGCNMALLSHKLTQMGADVIAIDIDIVQAEFFGRFIRENTDEEWKVDLRKIDIIEDEIKEDKVNIITMFGVLYWLEPHANSVVSDFQVDFPNHEFLVLQGNIHANKKKPLPLSMPAGMIKFLEQHHYSIYKQYNWRGYQKPLVIGQRNSN